MAETFRKAKIEHYYERLIVRKAALISQLEQTEFKDMREFIKGQISAIDMIAKELAAEFGLCVK